MKKIALLLTLLAALPATANYMDGLGYFENQQYPQAFAEFKPLADKDSERAQYYVGYMYLKGYGVDQDEELGLKYLQKSADQGFEKAEALMGYFLTEGIYMPQNRKKGLELYKKAAEKGDDEALLNLGVLYYLGESVEQDYDKALEYLNKVDKVNNPIVGRYMADIYLLSTKEEERNKARDLYQLAAANGDLASFHAIALLAQGKKDENQETSKKDMDEAVKYFTYAASQGYVSSQYVLGTLYANGEGVPKDIFKAYGWISFAANQGFTPAVTAQKQLESNMTLSELDKARREMLEIQRTVLGQVESPLKDAVIRGGKMTVVTANATQQKVGGGRRPRQRRRR